MTEIIHSFVNLVPITFAQSLLYGFVVLCVMIPFRLLHFPDLTCEGSFPLGGCLFAALLVAGAPPSLALIAAIAAGVVAGCLTAYVHLRFRINTLLAGILMITMLWSINLRIMGKSNIPLFSEKTVFDAVFANFTRDVGAQIATWVVVTVVLAAAVVWFLRTELGLAVRATGANGVMARAQGINTWVITLLGVGIANGFSAFAGAAVAQVQGYADVAMGFGILINALASLIIGEAIVGRSGVVRQVIAPFVGSVVYYQVISLGLAMGVHPSDLKLVTGLFVLGMLAMQRKNPGDTREAAVNA